MTPNVRRTPRDRLVKTYPEYEVQIDQLLEQGIPFEYIRRTVVLSRKHHVPAGLIVEILNDMMRRATGAQTDGES
jgi:hypothetical protein